MRAYAAIAAVFAGFLLAAFARAAEDPPPSIKPELKKAAHERWGYVITSDDQRLDGLVSTTPEKPIRIFDRKKSAYRDVKFEKIQSIEQAPDEEWLEQEWRWREGGSDEKVFTNRFYRAVKYRTVITLKSGETITGDAVAPIYVKTPEKRQLLELRKRQKSSAPAPKDELEPLMYMRKLVLTDEPPKPPEKIEEARGRVVARAHGRSGAWVHGRMGARAHGCMGAWAHVHPVHPVHPVYLVHRRRGRMDTCDSFMVRKA